MSIAKGKRGARQAVKRMDLISELLLPSNSE
jgi:hypothetical protein